MDKAHGQSPEAEHTLPKMYQLNLNHSEMLFVLASVLMSPQCKPLDVLKRVAAAKMLDESSPDALSVFFDKMEDLRTQIIATAKKDAVLAANLDKKDPFHA